MIDNITPQERWKFRSEVTGCFDNMLERSIPDYQTMRKAVTTVAEHYIQPDTWVVDLGCSKGEAIAPLIEKYIATNRFLGVETSEPMLKAAQERFKEFTKYNLVKIENLDLRNSYPTVRASVTLSILTLQFIPIEYRQKVVREAFKYMAKGGVFILVEKVLSSASEIGEFQVDSYLNMKRDNGYSAKQIEGKRKALEGVLVPVTAKWNEELLYSAGFSQVEPFWRWMNFGGWIAIK